MSDEKATPCHCGATWPRLTKKQIATLTRLRGFDVIVCPCGHEVESPETAHDIRKLGSINSHMAHQACAIGGAKLCAAFVNNPGSVLSRNCLHKPTMMNAKGVAVCTRHRDRP